jgi:hypothetical protein
MLVTDGRVCCPATTYGDAEVDGCYSCPSLTGAKFESSGDPRWVECRSPGSSPWASEMTAGAV